MTAELPDEFAGVVTICWAPKGRPRAVLGGWNCALMIDGQVVPGVMALEVHVEPHGPVRAEVTTLADENGEPIKSFRDLRVEEDGTPKTVTLTYLVAEMQLGISDYELKRLRSK